MTVTAKTLLEGRSSPICVKLIEKVQTALELMVEKEFSQLPIVDDDNRPLGLVTVDSILRALSILGITVEGLQVRDVAEKHQQFSQDVDLFDILGSLNTESAVLITDSNGRLQGIVTNWDTANYFRTRAQDLMLLEDIELSLREHINAAFADPSTGQTDELALQREIDRVFNAKALSEVKKAINQYCNRLPEKMQPDQSIVEAVCQSFTVNGKALKDLTLSQFTELLAFRWDSYGRQFSLRDDALRAMLKRVADIRNTVAHFRDEITPAERDALRFAARWFEQNTQIYPDTKPVEIKAPELKAGEIAPVEDEIQPDESLYANLALYLQECSLEVSQLVVPFAEIEKIIGGSLPPSARQHRSWWANDTTSHVQSRQWLSVGWRVSSVSLTAEIATFYRIDERSKMYIAFFSKLLSTFEKKTDFPVRKTSPQGSSWHLIGSYRSMSGAQIAVLGFSFSRSNRFRVELYIDSGDEKLNKGIFDRLALYRGDFDISLIPLQSIDVDIHVLDGEVRWERLDNRRASRLAIYHTGSIEDDPDSLEMLREWAIVAMINLQHRLSEFMNIQGFKYKA